MLLLHSCRLRHFLKIFLCVALICPGAYAQNIESSVLPASLVLASASFSPVILKGVVIDPKNPFKLKFILDNGDAKLTDEQFRDEANILIRYFLSALTIPADEMWVNLSPYESNRIVPEEFGLTDIGRDMLGQDYILKQLAASLTFPESESGNRYWQQIQNDVPVGAQRAAPSGAGTARRVPANLFNKIWIVPGKTQVLESGAKAYISQMSMKAMAEEDYFAMNENNVGVDLRVDPKQDSGRTHRSAPTDSFKANIIPLIEKEVNTGANFACLRQMQSAIILAMWFKDKLKTSIYNQLYIDKKKISGIESNDPQAAERIYNKYVESFKAGAYDYVKKNIDPIGKKVVSRRYYSGGVNIARPASAQTVADGVLAKKIEGRPSVEAALGINGSAPRLGQRIGPALALMAVLGAGGAALTVAPATSEAAPRRVAKNIKSADPIPTTAKDPGGNEYKRSPEGAVLIDPNEWDENKIGDAIEIYTQYMKETNNDREASLAAVAAQVGNVYTFIYDQYGVSFIGDDSGKVVTVDNVRKPKEKKMSKAEAAKRDEDTAKVKTLLDDMLRRASKVGPVLSSDGTEIVAEKDGIVFIGFVTNLLNGNVKEAEQQADGGFLAERSAQTMKSLLAAYKVANGIEDVKPNGVAKALEEWRVSLRKFAKDYYNMELTDEQMALAEKIHMLPGGWRRLTKEERKRYDAAPFKDGGAKAIIINGEERDVYVMFNGQPGITTCTIKELKDKLGMAQGTDLEDFSRGAIRFGLFGVEKDGEVGGISEQGLRLDVENDGADVLVFDDMPIDVSSFNGFGFQVTAIER